MEHFTLDKELHLACCSSPRSASDYDCQTISPTAITETISSFNIYFLLSSSINHFRDVWLQLSIFEL